MVTSSVMAFINKFFALCIICLVLSNLLVLSVTPTTVGATSKPSVPEFSVKFIDKSYNIPPTQTTDPFTGKTTTTPSYRVNEGWLEVTIKNQPFTSETDSRNQLFYRVEYKGSFGGDNDWHNLAYDTDTGYIQQSDSGNTIFVHYAVRFDSGVKLDIRVKAVIGYSQRTIPGWEVVVESSSDWSKIQTITITYGTSSTKPSQTTPQEDLPATPGNNQSQVPTFVFNPFFLLGVGVLLGVVVVAVVLLFTRKHLKSVDYTN